MRRRRNLLFFLLCFALTGTQAEAGRETGRGLFCDTEESLTSLIDVMSTGVKFPEALAAINEKFERSCGFLHAEIEPVEKRGEYTFNGIVWGLWKVQVTAVIVDRVPHPADTIQYIIKPLRRAKNETDL